MASLGAMLKEEITRLSRKEARKLVEPVRKASAGYRRDIAALKRQIVLLQRQVTALGRTSRKPEAAPAEAPTTRFVAKGLRTLRERLGVSQTNFGKLAGVSGQSIYNWERGHSVPRKAQLSVLAGLRSLGKREAQERLQQLTAKAGQKPRKAATR
jgi:DNA-binding transcriptional regulator YiaG